MDMTDVSWEISLWSLHQETEWKKGEAEKEKGGGKAEVNLIEMQTTKHKL